MDDALKVFAKAIDWPEPDPQTVNPQTRPYKSLPAALEPVRRKQASTGEKALDRWFREQRGNRRVPKRLKIPNEVMVNSGGPLKVTGNITLISENGTVTHANHLNLCRCGASKNKPLCDDQHLAIEFLDSGNIHQVSICRPITQPQMVTLTCVKNGPLKYRGYLRIYNNKGKEFISTEGALCRCGKSSKKPFCDGGGGCAGI